RGRRDRGPVDRDPREPARPPRGRGRGGAPRARPRGGDRLLRRRRGGRDHRAAVARRAGAVPAPLHPLAGLHGVPHPAGRVTPPPNGGIAPAMAKPILVGAVLYDPKVSVIW